MRILIFILWLTLGLVYSLIWIQRKSCCNMNTPALKSDSGNELKEENAPSPTQNELTKKANPEVTLLEDEGCVLFPWGKADPVLKPCFSAFRDSIAKSLVKGKTLEIISEYFEQENLVMSPGNIGLIRAAKIKDLFAQNINPDLMRVRGIARSDSTGKRNRLLYTLHTRQVFMNEQVKELDDKTLIYFKYASNQQENDVLVNQYITDLASRLKNTEEIINLVGHTDDDATAEHNLSLGLKRAQIIKNLLTAREIKPSRIKTISRGETEPIAPNDTEENRKQNRRVELTIIPPAK